jgi:hypothetical protein
VLHKPTIHNTAKTRSTGLVLNKNKSKKMTGTEEKLDDISTQLDKSPKLSHFLALQSRLAKNTAHVGMMLLKLQPYSTIFE